MINWTVAVSCPVVAVVVVAFVGFIVVYFWDGDFLVRILQISQPLYTFLRSMRISLRPLRAVLSFLSTPKLYYVFFGQLFVGEGSRAGKASVFFFFWTFWTRFAAFALAACGLSIFTFAFTFTFLFSTHTHKLREGGRGGEVP